MRKITSFSASVVGVAPVDGEADLCSLVAVDSNGNPFTIPLYSREAMSALRHRELVIKICAQEPSVDADE